MPAMRAKMRITAIENKSETQETLKFTAVAKDGAYPSDGSDEDNSYAKFSPAGALSLTVANPTLLNRFQVGDTFYLDFIRV